MSEYRYITVPAHVTLVDDEGKPAREATFREFIENRVRDAQHFGASLDGILAAVSLEQQFRDAKPGAVVKLSAREFGLLEASVKAPTGGYNVALMMQLVSFARAVAEAPESEGS